MEKNKFKDPKSVVKGIVAALLGVIAYCAVVAPLFKDGPYREVVADTFATTGFGLGLAIFLVGAVWLGALAFLRR